MPGIEITKTNGGTTARPLDGFGSMRHEMDHLFERFENGRPSTPPALGHAFESSMTPDLDVRESSKEITIEVDLPGVDEKDATVTFANGVLTIKGDRKSQDYGAEEARGHPRRAADLNQDDLT